MALGGWADYAASEAFLAAPTVPRLGTAMQ
jgi:hypothetical protein